MEGSTTIYKKLFTRRQNSRNGIIHSTLDYWFISVGLSFLIKTKINPGNKSDSIITVSLDLIETQKPGRSFLKFNLSLLNNLNYINVIKNTISELKAELATENQNFTWEFAEVE